MTENMIGKYFTVITDSGLHARPATLLVSKASELIPELILHYEGKSVNLKSIMGIMSLGIPKGASFKITAKGEEAEAAINSLEKMLSSEGIASA